MSGWSPGRAPYFHKKRRLEADSGSPVMEAQVQAAVAEWFNKKFQYRRPDKEEWRLPRVASPGSEGGGETWQVPSLMRLKEELNATKSQLNDKDAKKWHAHTSSTNPAGLVVGELRHRVEVPTQAWAKFWEILSAFPVARPQLGSYFNTVHLCEAPGAFIAALNHFLCRDDGPVEWSWLGTTLNPYYEGNGLGEMIDDVRLIQGTHSNWYFGPDDTGNLMCPKTLAGLLADTAHMEGIQLVTADGSIDCMQNPAEQEAIVSWLHHWEAVTALRLLGPGGSLVVKVFTLLEAPAVCLLFLLNCLFQQVNVFKPGTSKGGNSEVYIVCLGFEKSKADAHLQELQDFISDSGNSSRPMFEMKDLPASFLEQHEECEKYFIGHQTRVIENNVQLFREMSAGREAWLQRLRQACVDHFFRSCRVGSIAPECRLLRQKPGWKTEFERVPRLSVAWYSDQMRKLCLSHEKREEVAALSWHQRIHEKSLYPDFSPILHSVSHVLVLTSCGPLQLREVRDWYVTQGQPLSTIRSSRVCLGRLLDTVNEILEHREVRETQLQKPETVPSFILECLGTVLRCDGCEASRDFHLTSDKVYVWNDGCAVLQPVKAALERWCQCCPFDDLPDLDDLHPDSDSSSCSGSPSKRDWWGSGDGAEGAPLSPRKEEEDAEETSLRPSSQSMLWHVSRHPSLPCTQPALPPSSSSSRGRKKPCHPSPAKPTGFEQLLSGKGHARRTLFPPRKPFTNSVASSPPRSTGGVEIGARNGQGLEGVVERDTSAGVEGGGVGGEAGKPCGVLQDSSSSVEDGGKASAGIQCSGRSDGLVVVASVVADSGQVATEEADSRPLFFNFVIDLLKKLPQGSDVVVHTSTCLTRFTCALVYILARCFAQAVMRPVPGGRWLQMVLVLQDFVSPSPSVLRYLQSLPHTFPTQPAAAPLQCVAGGGGNASSWPGLEVLSLIPPAKLFGDEVFVRQVKAANELVVATFIQTMLDEERRHHPQT